jgi:hypothetical protein
MKLSLLISSDRIKKQNRPNAWPVSPFAPQGRAIKH